jgi:hypothetical protein
MGCIGKEFDLVGVVWVTAQPMGWEGFSNFDWGFS